MWKGRSAKRRCVSKEDHVIYIPVLKTLQGRLKSEAILSEVYTHIRLCNNLKGSC